MIEATINVLQIIATVFIAGGVFVGVIALAFEPLLTGRRK